MLLLICILCVFHFIYSYPPTPRHKLEREASGKKDRCQSMTFVARECSQWFCFAFRGFEDAVYGSTSADELDLPWAQILLVFVCCGCVPNDASIEVWSTPNHLSYRYITWDLHSSDHITCPIPNASNAPPTFCRHKVQGIANMLDHYARQSALGRLETSQQGSEFRCSWRTRLSHTYFHYVSYTFQSPPCSLCLLMLPLPISHLIAPRSHSTRPSLVLLAARKKGSHKSNTFDLPSEPTISMHALKYMQLCLSPSPRKGFTTLQGAMEVDLVTPTFTSIQNPPRRPDWSSRKICGALLIW